MDWTIIKTDSDMKQKRPHWNKRVKSWSTGAGLNRLKSEPYDPSPGLYSRGTAAKLSLIICSMATWKTTCMLAVSVAVVKWWKTGVPRLPLHATKTAAMWWAAASTSQSAPVRAQRWNSQGIHGRNGQIFSSWKMVSSPNLITKATQWINQVCRCVRLKTRTTAMSREEERATPSERDYHQYISFVSHCISLSTLHESVKCNQPWPWKRSISLSNPQSFTTWYSFTVLREKFCIQFKPWLLSPYPLPFWTQMAIELFLRRKN